MVQRWLLGADRERLSEHFDSLPAPDLTVHRLVNLGKRIAASD